MTPGERRETSRYELLVKVGTGGMATVYVGRIRGRHGFSRLVAVKRAHPHLVRDEAARRMLVREATLASRINHANVVAVQDVEETDDGLLLVMDYVEGCSLAELLDAPPPPGAGGQRSGEGAIPAAIALKVVLDACAGLHAAHELPDDEGRPLRLAHRDVSPQNILVGADGTARITDFGIAKVAQAVDVSRTTASLRGKPAYLAPEYLQGAPYDVACDVFAMGVVAWEAIAGRRLFRADDDPETIRRVIAEPVPVLSGVAPRIGTHLDNVVAKALEKQPSRRYPTVHTFAVALEAIARRNDLLATSSEVASYVRSAVGPQLEARRKLLRAGTREATAVADETRGDAGPDTVSFVGPRAALARAAVEAPVGAASDPVRGGAGDASASFVDTTAWDLDPTDRAAVHAARASARRARWLAVACGLALGALAIAALSSRESGSPSAAASSSAEAAPRAAPAEPPSPASGGSPAASDASPAPAPTAAAADAAESAAPVSSAEARPAGAAAARAGGERSRLPRTSPPRGPKEAPANPYKRP